MFPKCFYKSQDLQLNLEVLLTLKFPAKLLIASRNGKGELAFRGSFPSDAFIPVEPE